ncbi:DUF1302 domain-containing protein [Herbaspirillum sp. NPDC087042]|uniref:DUF1302 domain-containing protein n=1 Tax=Herbaspirillum sp. NPDC087042 TaxID=3364004 RepID=UPI00380C8612
MKHNDTRALARPASTLAVAAAAALSTMSLSAHAVQFGDADAGWSGSFDSTVSYGMTMRTQSSDCSVVGNDHGGCNRGTSNALSSRYNLASGTGYANADFNYSNFDGGGLNYKKGDITSMVLKGTHELSLKTDNGWSALGRFTWFGDSRVSDTRSEALSQESKDYASSRIDLLDLWVSKRFDLNGQPAKVKVGNQVISWGEDIFIPGGVNQINAIDMQKFHTPGTQLKEIFIPAPMASFNVALNENISVEGYYQLRWNSYRFDSVGTFFSTYNVLGKGNRPGYYPSSVVNDFNGAGTCQATTPTGKCGDPATSGLSDASMVAAGLAVPFAGENKPRNSGQFGFALRFNAPDIDSEFALYYQRYHDKIPFIGYTSNGTPGVVTSYSWNYGEDRSLFGASMNTKVGPVAVGAELSYRPRDGVAIDPTVPYGSKGASGIFDPNSVYDVGFQPGYVNERKWQAHLTGFYTYSRNDPLGSLVKAMGASDGFLLGEMAGTWYPRLDTSGATPYFLPNYSLPSRFSWGYVVEAGFNYPNVLDSGITLTPQIDWFQSVKGTSPNATPFIEGSNSLSLSLSANYRDKWRGNLQWVRYAGGGDNNLMRDRGFVAASISYSF